MRILDLDVSHMSHNLEISFGDDRSALEYFSENKK